jgi:hypothetical protein
MQNTFDKGTQQAWHGQYLIDVKLALAPQGVLDLFFIEEK